MARVTELTEMLEPLAEVSPEEMEAHLTLVGKEASYVGHLAGELKAGCVRPEEVPALLENLAARLAQLASPASPWRGIGRTRKPSGEGSRHDGKSEQKGGMHVS